MPKPHPPAKPVPAAAATPAGKPRLGRGLSSLIRVSVPPPESPAPEPTAIPATGATELPLDQIRPNPHQPRRSFDNTALAELAASIKTNGLIQPIVVRQVAGGAGGYELIAGERRLRAAKLAGLSTIPALVRDVDGFTQAQLALVENIQRQDLNPIDRAQGYRTLLDQLGLTQAELAGRLGEDRSTIANFSRLLDLPPAVQDLVRTGDLSLGHAKLLAGAPNAADQLRLAQLCVSQSLSVRNLERLLKSQPVTPPPPPTPGASTAHLKEVETAVTRQLGLRVQLRTAAKKGKGRLTIHYTTLDQFDQLLERLGVTLD